MGVNAVTSVPTYTDGEILEASRLNVTNSGIPVFATTTTRDAAFGGTGEKVLAEGQMAYIENIAGSSAVQYYDGAAWQTLVTGGMTVVKAETSVSATGTINVDNVFSSTYTNYLVTVRGTTASGTDVYWALRTGGVTAATNYNLQSLEANGTSISGTRLTSQTRAVCGSFGPTMSFLQLTLSGPNLAEATTGVSHGNYGSTSGIQSRLHSQIHTTATSYDGIAITFDANFTGTYTIYGLAKS